jgi:hypothetical protein
MKQQRRRMDLRQIQIENKVFRDNVLRTCGCACVCVCVCICACACMCVCVCVCVLTNPGNVSHTLIHIDMCSPSLSQTPYFSHSLPLSLSPSPSLSLCLTLSLSPSLFSLPPSLSASLCLTLSLSPPLFSLPLSHSFSPSLIISHFILSTSRTPILPLSLFFYCMCTILSGTFDDVDVDVVVGFEIESEIARSTHTSSTKRSHPTISASKIIVKFV